MQTKTVYHYSSVKFDNFDIAKCDGFLFTSIKPEQVELLNEIGVSGANYCAKCQISFEETCGSDSNSNIEELLKDSEFDAVKCEYDGFTDYALIDNSKIKILEWIKL